jgi:hypothetical protein
MHLMGAISRTAEVASVTLCWVCMYDVPPRYPGRPLALLVNANTSPARQLLGKRSSPSSAQVIHKDRRHYADEDERNPENGVNKRAH